MSDELLDKLFDAYGNQINLSSSVEKVLNEDAEKFFNDVCKFCNGMDDADGSIKKSMLATLDRINSGDTAYEIGRFLPMVSACMGSYFEMLDYYEETEEERAYLKKAKTFLEAQFPNSFPEGRPFYLCHVHKLEEGLLVLKID